MNSNIDFDFISKLEGGRKINGYVPNPENSNSGVTIATGFDIGQRNENDLRALKLTETLIEKLKPYLGVKGVDAKRILKEKPLTISLNEAELIDKRVKFDHIEKLKQSFNAQSDDNTKFSELPKQAQTVIASVSFQYGPSLKLRTPNFWNAVIGKKWQEAVKLLNDFKDIYPTRRKKEAQLLEQLLETTP